MDAFLSKERGCDAASVGRKEGRLGRKEGRKEGKKERMPAYYFEQGRLKGIDSVNAR